MDSMKHRRLQELDRSDFEIVKDEPDIRGWDVKDDRGEKLGDVEDLIVDAREKEVRYMVVDLDNNKLKLDHHKVLIPIGLAELDERHDDVLIPTVTLDQIVQLPVYDRNHLTADVERDICTVLGRGTENSMERNISRENERDLRNEQYMPKEREERLRNEKENERREREKENERSRKEKVEVVKKDRSESSADKEDENKEVDPDFYRHEYYNVDNLYKNRLHEAKSVPGKKQPEYIRGLILWERISEGGIVPGESESSRSESSRIREGNYRDMDEEERMQRIRDRRRMYEQRRYGDDYESRERDLNDKRDRRDD